MKATRGAKWQKQQHNLGNRTLTAGMLHSWLLPTVSPPLQESMKNVNAYNSRLLTYKSDTFDAFRGILSRTPF
jgi:hypothetical protein